MSNGEDVYRGALVRIFAAELATRFSELPVTEEHLAQSIDHQAASELKLVDIRTERAEVNERLVGAVFGSMPTLGREIDALCSDARTRRRIYNAVVEAAEDQLSFLHSLNSYRGGSVPTSVITDHIGRQTEAIVARNRRAALSGLAAFAIIASLAWVVVLLAAPERWPIAVGISVGAAWGGWSITRSFDPYDTER